MAELQTIAHGEGLWDKKANSNFALLNNALEKVGGGSKRPPMVE